MEDTHQTSSSGVSVVPTGILLVYLWSDIMIFEYLNLDETPPHKVVGNKVKGPEVIAIGPKYFVWHKSSIKR